MYLLFVFLLVLIGPSHGDRTHRSFDPTDHPLIHTKKLLILPKEELPLSYDIRNLNGRNYASPIRNQMIPTYCGCCWAMAATSTLVDRYSLVMEGRWPANSMLLSVQQLLNCGTAGTCNGGSSLQAFEWISKNGIADETCAPYQASDQACTPLTMCSFCNDSFEDGWNYGCRVVHTYPRMWVTDFGPITPEQAKKQGVTMVDAMKSEIAARGPISCNIATDVPWDHYKSGIIMAHPWNQTDHLVGVSGWGTDTESKVDYWIVRNSFGSYWGELGWFKIEMGKNAMGIESQCSWGVPKYDGKIAQ